MTFQSDAAPCPLCAHFDPPDTPARINNLGTQYYVECRRCGSFKIDDQLGREFSEEEALELSGAVRVATDQGLKAPHIAAHTVEGLRTRARLPRAGAEFFDHVLNVIAVECKYPGRPTKAISQRILAARALLPTPAFGVVLRALRDEGLITLPELEEKQVRATLTAAGWRRVAEVSYARTSSKRAFVAMAFGLEEVGLAYQNGIEPALLECGYEPPFLVNDPAHEERAGQPDYQRKIDDRIFAEIRRSRFVIADASFRRPNVFYEAGFAEGLGLPVFWTCRKADVDGLSFDTRQIEHILWVDADDLREAIVDRLGRRGLRLKG